MTNKNPEQRDAAAHGRLIETTDVACVFCMESGGEVLFQDEVCRVVLAPGEEGAAFPGFCRVICNRHVAELSDLPGEEQVHLFQVAMATEQAVRAVQHPDKMNIASLGNLVPHVHWHVIPRWRDDSHFPSPIWAAAKRAVPARRAVGKTALRNALGKAMEACVNPSVMTRRQ